jgi:hypothetical protein
MVFTSALNLTFSPGEKEQPQSDYGFAMIVRPILSREFSRRRRTILLLLGEKAGLREDVSKSWDLNCYGQAGKLGIKSKS